MGDRKWTGVNCLETQTRCMLLRACGTVALTAVDSRLASTQNHACIMSGE